MATVVTFLSPSPAASRRVLRKIQKWITAAAASSASTTASGTQDIDLISFHNDSSADACDDALTRALLPSNALLKFLTPKDTIIDSQALPLPNDSLLHCLSLQSNRSDVETDAQKEVTTAANQQFSLHLFSIQSLTAHVNAQEHDSSSTGGDLNKLLIEARSRLARALLLGQNGAAPRHPMSSLRILRSAWTGRGDSKDLLQHSSLPILDLTDGDDDRPAEFDETRINDTWNQPGALKEIVIPSYPTDTYPNGQSLFTALQQSSHVHRPMTGLYQLPQGLCIRPLPAAKEDRALPSPSLIFHTNSLLQNDHRDPETIAFKIGFTGVGTKGQLMLRDKTAASEGRSSHSDGVDVRLCSAIKPCSMFSEAQESLLASSLQELQSVHVMNTTSKSSLKNCTSGKVQRENSEKSEATEEQVNLQDDPNTNNTDCWVEFRANLKHPQGFVRRK